MADKQTDAPFVPPVWVKKKVKENFFDFLKDVVYNVYSCGCFLINDFDQKRKGRENQVREPGESKFVCECKKGRFICKVKICSECSRIMISRKQQKNGMCRDCTAYLNTRNDKANLFFYQNGKLIDEMVQNPTYTEEHCKYRKDCLNDVVTLPEKEFNVRIWCYGCPRYEDERNI